MVREPKRLVLLAVVLLALAGWGCPATKDEPPAEPAAEGTTPSPTEEGGLQPPDGGPIDIDKDGYKQGTDPKTPITYVTSTDLWIPTGFLGSVSQITFNPGNLAMSSAEFAFPSGAKLKVATGSPATWQCMASGASTWGTCATRAGTTISSQFAITVGTNHATVRAGTNPPHTLSGTATLRIQ